MFKKNKFSIVDLLFYWFFPIKMMSLLVFPYLGLPIKLYTVLNIIFVALLLSVYYIKLKIRYNDLIFISFVFYISVIIVVYGYNDYILKSIAGITLYSYYFNIIFNWLSYYLLARLLCENNILNLKRINFVFVSFLSILIIAFSYKNKAGFFIDYKEFKYSVSYLNVADIYSLCLLFLMSTIKGFYKNLFFIFIGCVVIFLIGSRSSLVVYIIASMFLILIIDYKKALLFITILVLSFFVFSNILLDNIESYSRYMILLTSYSDDASYIGREVMFNNGVKSIIDNFYLGDFGGQINILNMGEQRWGTYIHNILSYWRQFGLIGFIFIVFFIILSFVYFLRCLPYCKYDTYYLMYVLSFVYCVLMVFFFRSFNFTYLFFLFGLIPAKRK